MVVRSVTSLNWRTQSVAASSHLAYASHPVACVSS
jgi:hypothetical protein